MFKDPNLDLLINLGTYKPKYVALRVFIISVVAVSLFKIAELISHEDLSGIENHIFGYFLILAAFNSVSEGNLIAIRFLSRYKKIRGNLYLQALSVVSITLGVTFLWIAIADRIFINEKVLQHTVTQITLFVGLLIIVIHLLVFIISNLAKEWMNNKKEINELKQAKLLSDYNLLKDRLNPHFLFNNLSVLKSLIHYNPKNAEIFIQNFTNVYRYVLNSHEEKLVQLLEELKFLESYIAIHKERIGDGLSVYINIDNEDYTKKIPPLSLQLLVENAIKHNTANKLRPLQLSIYTDQQQIIVKNNLNKKDSTYSTYTGLQTLKAQYKLIANQEISIIEDETQYTVKLPLIK